MHGRCTSLVSGWQLCSMVQDLQQPALHPPPVRYTSAACAACVLLLLHEWLLRSALAPPDSANPSLAHAPC